LEQSGNPDLSGAPGFWSLTPDYRLPSEREKIALVPPAPLCPVAPEDGTGVGSADRTGVKSGFAFI